MLKNLLTPHVRAQALRFLRLFVVAAAALLVALPAGVPVTLSLVVSVVIASAETAYRQIFPVKPSPPNSGS